MKKLSLSLLAILIIGFVFAACDREPKLTPQGEKTKALNDKYRNKIVGKWYYEEPNDNKYFVKMYNFKADGNYEFEARWFAKDTKTKNKNDAPQQWVQTNVCEKHGKWQLRWNKEYNCPSLELRDIQETGGSVVLMTMFEYVNENELCIGPFGDKEAVLDVYTHNKPSVWK